MDIDLPGTISAETIEQARPAVERLRMVLDAGKLPFGLSAESLSALLMIMEGVSEAAAGDVSDLSPSEAADRLGMARPSVMRLIARGDLSSRKDGGHYVLAPRELRAFQARLAAARREAFSNLTEMVDEFGT